MRKLALFAIPAALLLFAGTALGHTATSTCEHITISKSSLTATVFDYNSTTVVLGPVKSGTYPIAPGTYDVIWSDGFMVPIIKVAACPSPTPSVAPTPHATPPATGTAAHEQYIAETRSDVLVVLGLLAALGVAYVAMFRRVRR